MLKLDLSNEPAWLDLGHGVRVKLRPLTTVLMVAARNDPAVQDLAEDATDEESALAFAKALARVAILDWEGVGDAEGNPVPDSPDAIDALLDIWPIFEAFQLAYVSKGLMLEQEKTSPRFRRMVLRRGRAILRGLRRAVPGLPGAAEPTRHNRGLAGLGSCRPPRRPAACPARRRRRLGSERGAGYGAGAGCAGRCGRRTVAGH